MQPAQSPLELVTAALYYAAEKHANQKRKGEASEPYINHLAEVANLLAQATGGVDPHLVAAGLLHDVVEDAGATRQDIETRFGEDVAALVMEVTDDKSLPKARRKELQVEHAPRKSTRAKMIKLADKTSNLRSLAASPPAQWDRQRLIEYCDWAHRVVAGLRGANPQLEQLFDEAAMGARDAIVRRYGGANP